MSKKKKTRKQKEISRLRRELQVTNSSTPYSLHVSELNIKQPSSPSSVDVPSSPSYAHVIFDMKKTLYVTAAIFIGNFILYFLIARNLLPFLK